MNKVVTIYGGPYDGYVTVVPGYQNVLELFHLKEKPCAKPKVDYSDLENIKVDRVKLPIYWGLLSNSKLGYYVVWKG